MPCQGYSGGGLYPLVGCPRGSGPDNVLDGVAKVVGGLSTPFPPFSLDSSSISFIRRALKSSDVGDGAPGE
jgi:hypothetical protein